MPENLSNVLDSTEPTLLTTGWGRTEGPLWHAGGYVTFVDLAGSRLLRWDPHGQVTVVRSRPEKETAAPSTVRGVSSCAKVPIIAGSLGWMRRAPSRPWRSAGTANGFNKPTMSCVAPTAAFFSQDPELRLPPAQREIGFSGVFRIDSQGQVHLATDACEYPNGLAFLAR